MPRRIVLFVVIAAAFAALFVRLGIWQLHRLDERRQSNALVRARLVGPAVDVSTLPPDAAQARFHHVRVTGTPDYEHELVFTMRSHDGSPGVYLLTPIRRPGNDTAVLVNRGWIFTPDGMTVQESRWREPDTSFVGYAEVVGSEPATAVMRENPRLIRHVDRAEIARAIPYPVSPVYVVATEPAATNESAEATQAGQSRPRRLEPPPLDEGPHLSYAIQWFSFAVIAVVGAGIVAVRGKRDQATVVGPAGASERA